MSVDARVCHAGHSEVYGLIAPERDVRVLPGEDQRRLQPGIPQRLREGGELDRLGAGPDDDPDIMKQSAP